MMPNKPNIDDVDYPIYVLEKARKKAEQNELYDRVGEYIIDRFYRMSDSKHKDEYYLKLNPYEKEMIEQYLFTPSQRRYEVKLLLSETKLSPQAVLEGKANKAIFRQIKNIKVELMSVDRESKRAERELRTKKILSSRNRRIGKVIAALAIAGSMVVAASNAIKLNEEIKNDHEVDLAIGAIISDKENDKRDIVSQNTYIVGIDNRGEPIIAYNNEGIAKDILKVCSQSPQLFDLCVYNAYQNMSYNRLENMDDVFEYLKIFTKNNEELQSINHRVQNCKVFLDYVVSMGYLNPNDENYYKTVEDINNYKKSKDFEEFAYNSLSKDAKKRINELLEKYRDSKNNLYEEYKDDLEGLETHGR